MSRVIPSRGDVFRDPANSIRCQVLGGPVTHCHTRFYTIQYLDEVVDGKRHVPAGTTTLLRESTFGMLPYLGNQPVARFYADHRYENVIEQDCPNCDIEEMIFYEGDYICAWCREKLEE